MVKVSIITPFKNAEKYIRATAESIFKQELTNWEWILVNDHSAENELNELSPFLSDKRITVLNNKGIGIVAALETAFEQVRGEYVTRMDADDLMPSEKLKLFVAALEENQATIVTGKVTYFVASGEISTGYQSYQNWLNERVEQQDFYTSIYRECSVASGNWLMRKVDLEKCGGFRNLNYPEDYDLLFRWYAFGFSIFGINAVTHLWRDHDLRTSKNSSNYQQEAFFQLKINRFIELDWKVEKTIVINGSGQKGRLVAKQLIANDIPFYWISHEPEKFPNGIFQHSVIGLSEFNINCEVLLLHTTMHSEIDVRNWYQGKTGMLQFYRL